MMRKWICAVLVLCLLPVMALAESVDAFSMRWNLIAGQYGCPELSSDSASDSGFAGDGWKIDIAMDGGNYSEVSVYAEDTETFLSLSVMTGLTVAEGYANDLYEYLGKVLLMFLRGRAGEEAAPYSFLDHYVFQMTKQGDGYLFTLQVV